MGEIAMTWLAVVTIGLVLAIYLLLREPKGVRNRTGDRGVGRTTRSWSRLSPVGGDMKKQRDADYCR
jgi:hypothetical protein